MNPLSKIFADYFWHKVIQYNFIVNNGQMYLQSGDSSRDKRIKKFC